MESEELRNAIEIINKSINIKSEPPDTNSVKTEPQETVPESIDTSESIFTFTLRCKAPVVQYDTNFESALPDFIQSEHPVEIQQEILNQIVLPKKSIQGIKVLTAKALNEKVCNDKALNQKAFNEKALNEKATVIKLQKTLLKRQANTIKSNLLNHSLQTLTRKNCLTTLKPISKEIQEQLLKSRSKPVHMLVRANEMNKNILTLKPPNSKHVKVNMSKKGVLTVRPSQPVNTCAQKISNIKAHNSQALPSALNAYVVTYSLPTTSSLQPVHSNNYLTKNKTSPTTPAFPLVSPNKNPVIINKITKSAFQTVTPNRSPVIIKRTTSTKSGFQAVPVNKNIVTMNKSSTNGPVSILRNSSLTNYIGSFKDYNLNISANVFTANKIINSASTKEEKVKNEQFSININEGSLLKKSINNHVVPPQISMPNQEKQAIIIKKSTYSLNRTDKTSHLAGMQRQPMLPKKSIVLSKQTVNATMPSSVSQKIVSSMTDITFKNLSRNTEGLSEIRKFSKQTEPKVYYVCKADAAHNRQISPKQTFPQQFGAHNEQMPTNKTHHQKDRKICDQVGSGDRSHVIVTNCKPNTSRGSFFDKQLVSKPNRNTLPAKNIIGRYIKSNMMSFEEIASSVKSTKLQRNNRILQSLQGTGISITKKNNIQKKYLACKSHIKSVSENITSTNLTADSNNVTTIQHKTADASTIETSSIGDIFDLASKVDETSTRQHAVPETSNVNSSNSDMNKEDSTVKLEPNVFPKDEVIESLPMSDCYYSKQDLGNTSFSSDTVKLEAEEHSIEDLYTSRFTNTYNNMAVINANDNKTIKPDNDNNEKFNQENITVDSVTVYKAKKSLPLEIKIILEKLPVVFCHHCREARQSKRAVLMHIRKQHPESFRIIKPKKLSPKKAKRKTHKRQKRQIFFDKDTPYECFYCTYFTRCKSSYLEHKKKKPCSEKIRSRKYMCDNCEYNTLNKKNFVRHMLNHIEIKMFKCDKCPYENKRRYLLKLHVYQKHTLAEFKFKCAHCSYETNTRYSLFTHLHTHDLYKHYKCSECNLTCRTRAAIQIHERVKHSRRLKIFQIKPRNLKQPYKRNFNVLFCDYCPFTTMYKWDLVPHILRHLGKTAYKCKYCNFATYYRGNFVCHVRIHTGEKPFKCNLCDFACIHPRGLKRHKRNEHVDIFNERPNPNEFTCKKCNFQTDTRSNMMSHIKVHKYTVENKETPFECPCCFYSTYNPRHLRQHINRFHTENKFKCPQCTFVAMDYTHLKTHMKIHGEKIFKCTHCDFSTVHKSSFERHGNIHKKI